MVKVLVVGGGWSGTAAALAAAKAGADVTLVERTDMLLGTGLVGGIMRNNGRWTATEEAIALGGGELFQIADSVSRHRDIEFPGHKHASLYDIGKIEPAVKIELLARRIEIRLETTAKDVIKDGSRIVAVKLSDGSSVDADVVVEATGSAGGMANCGKYGNGCAMCVLRCPTFGGRVSIAAKAGVEEKMGQKADGSIGAMSGSCKLLKESLAPEIVKQLDETGVAVVPIPEALQKGEEALSSKACQQYALPEFAANVILLDTGHAKLMAPYFPLETLRQIPGFEEARYEDPYSGGLGNSMRYLALAPRDDKLQVQGVDNLFCGGEKAGLLVGHTEAIITGTLAGHNAVRQALNLDLLELPRTLMIGEAIAYVRERMETPEGMGQKFTFSGSVLFNHLKELGMYTTDKEEVAARVDTVNLTGVFNQQLAK
ncbi:MAG: FAD-dependent oxidoreductase [Firmicutes bacterium]|nr:FAD-dependent oxidoreductase [Bacillota bacterium]